MKRQLDKDAVDAYLRDMESLAAIDEALKIRHRAEQKEQSARKNAVHEAFKKAHALFPEEGTPVIYTDPDSKCVYPAKITDCYVWTNPARFVYRIDYRDPNAKIDRPRWKMTEEYNLRPVNYYAFQDQLTHKYLDIGINSSSKEEAASAYLEHLRPSLAPGVYEELTQMPLKDKLETFESNHGISLVSANTLFKKEDSNVT